MDMSILFKIAWMGIILVVIEQILSISSKKILQHWLV